MIKYILIPFLLIFSSCGVNTNLSKINVEKDELSITTPNASINLSGSGLNVNTPNGNISIGQLGTIIDIHKLQGEDKMQYSYLFQNPSDIQDCESEYKQLIKRFGNNYLSCFMQRPTIDSCNLTKSEKAKVNIAVIFDTSGSMRTKIGDESMLSLAKDELSTYISNLGSNVGGGVIIYGHKGNSTDAGKNESCNGIDLIGKLGSEKQEILSKINNLTPNGWTPIDLSLQRANQFLNEISNPNDKKIILLISDGQETCGGNPINTAKEIYNTKNTFIDVIGFNVQGDTQSQLIDIAKNGGGKYSDVRSRADFENVFQDTKNFLNDMQCGASKASIQLRTGVSMINTYFTCSYMLKDEEVRIINNTTQSCRDTVLNNLEIKQAQTQSQLERLKSDAENIIDGFDENINKITNSF